MSNSSTNENGFHFSGASLARRSRCVNGCAIQICGTPVLEFFALSAKAAIMKQRRVSLIDGCLKLDFNGSFVPAHRISIAINVWRL